MKVLLISAILIQAWCYAHPKPNGVATFAFRDSAGNRYGGSYDLGNEVLPFNEPIITSFRVPYVPDFFNNYGNMLPHEAAHARTKRRIMMRHLRPRMLGSVITSQRLAFLDAQRALDLTYNRGGYNPNFFRFPFGGFPFGPSAFNMDRFGENSAFASGAIGPGYRHQSAIISPANAEMPNVDITDRLADRFNDPSGNPDNFYSVSSSSFASSNNDNGKLSGFRQAETVVNDNGKITKYKVHS